MGLPNCKILVHLLDYKSLGRLLNHKGSDRLLDCKSPVPGRMDVDCRLVFLATVAMWASPGFVEYQGLVEIKVCCLYLVKS